MCVWGTTYGPLASYFLSHSVVTDYLVSLRTFLGERRVSSLLSGQNRNVFLKADSWKYHSTTKWWGFFSHMTALEYSFMLLATIL